MEGFLKFPYMTTTLRLSVESENFKGKSNIISVSTGEKSHHMEKFYKCRFTDVRNSALKKNEINKNKRKIRRSRSLAVAETANNMIA